MTRTFVRQDTQIRNSDVYDDTVTPSEANFETNPVEIETDLNNIRSMLSHLLDVQAGNWYDIINTPSAFDAGSQRGVSDLNTDLHALERKRVLVKAVSLADVTVGAATAAAGTLTSTANLSNGDTVTIGSTVYTMTSPFVDAAGNIDASVSQAQTMENLRRAINGDGVAGTNYGTGTAAHPDVTAGDTGTTVTLTASKSGTFGNSIATTEASTTASFGSATLTGGAGGDASILGTGELPPNTTAALGAVTSLGTVVVSHTGTFGTATLDQLSGATAISPKNFVEVVDGTTRDPILDGGDRIYGLLSAESGISDGTTITDATTTRVQVTYVKINATGDGLETIDGSALSGVDVNLCFTERKALDDLTEQDFLRGAAVDVPGAATVNRQVAYDNQGTSPVDQTTDATLDLEGAGLVWSIRDDLEANLFRVIEGSAGGTSEVEISAATDVFDVDAPDVDFDAGISVATGKTRPIDIGENDGVVETTAGDLRMLAAGELYLDDANQTGSTWAQTDGIKLSETTTEWDLFETNFGEVSLLNAISQAFSGGVRSKVQAVVTATAAADSDVNLATYANVDTQLPAYDTVTFVDDVEVFVNGILQRNGANAAANEDVYPGTSPAVGDLRFEYTLKSTGSTPDVITVIVNGQ